MTFSNDPAWLAAARKYIGVAEIPGKEHAPQIVRWLATLKAWWREDETPWCGVLTAACLRETGVALPKHWYRAKGYFGEPDKPWGSPLVAPALGCIVIFERKGGGHVGFVVGKEPCGNLRVLGGNQSNRVSIASFERTRVAGYRWPPGVVLPPLHMLPTFPNTTGKVSTNEA